MRGDSGPQGQSSGVRRQLRNLWAHMVVRNSAGGLAVGKLNDEFYRRFGAPRIISAPHSVDNDRFAQAPPLEKSALLAQWGLTDERPVVLFSGKLTSRKRPLDILSAIALVPVKVTILFVGDGELADELRTSIEPGYGTVTGFINQSQLPSYYNAADVLILPSEAEPWGLVVNEAMAAGTIPVVSDHVGAAADLVNGIGEVYPCGDVKSLANALMQALERNKNPATRRMILQRVSQHSLKRTAEGFEEAAITVSRARQVRRPHSLQKEPAHSTQTGKPH